MVATRFAVAVHILLLVATETPGQATSVRMAGSVNTNPVVVRRIAAQLARAGLIRVRRGPGGAELARSAEAITLRDVWKAVHPSPQPLVPIHPHPNRASAVGRAIPGLLRARFADAEDAFQEALGHITLAALADGLEREMAHGPGLSMALEQHGPRTA
ncbi:Rrf2 family transcriptional regulator [Roseomonas sp. NAR14]|uniref:Rrf2 family transcriptional regulator n=1 Tax=Roseomonas acroporae TaxID=2937791 RepID=A0A9X2BSX4_9PROT|nr:Rrf2 family transcriptional regulator [Roseomonas acroporae]MCK8784003.1 Rrf2 family transcriptional regulator [Roseomonas acroporae]